MEAQAQLASRTPTHADTHPPRPHVPQSNQGCLPSTFSRDSHNWRTKLSSCLSQGLAATSVFLPGERKDVWEGGRVGSEAPGVYFGHLPLFVFPRPGQYGQ